MVLRAYEYNCRTRSEGRERLAEEGGVEEKAAGVLEEVAWV